MKKLFYLVLATLMIGNVAAFGQAKVKKEKTPQERAEKRVNYINKQVGPLTEAEVADLKALFVKQEIEKDNVKKAQIERRNRNQADVKSILGAERFQKMQDIRKERKENRQVNKAGRKAARKDRRDGRRGRQMNGEACGIGAQQ